MSTITNPPEMQEFWSPHGTLGRPLHGCQPQTTIPSVSKDSVDCNTKVQFHTFRIVVVMVYQPTTSSHKSQNYVPCMGRLVRYCVNCNRTFHFRLYLLTFIFIIEIIFIKSFGDKNSVILQSDLFCFHLK